MEIKNTKLSNDDFFAERKEVLEQWPTGKGVDFDEAVKYQKAIPTEKRFGDKMAKAAQKGITLIQPRAGVALYDEHIKLLQYLETEGEADLLPSTIDSYTRLNRYKEAEIGIEKSKESGRSMLNGFPAVNYGVDICRTVTSSLKSPVQVRHGTPDARLLTEIAIAGGFTSYEGGGISYNIPYSKNHSLEKTIAHWQYADRLIGLYEEAGISINREPFGPLTGTLVPPCISNVVAVIESILAATQGVKDITVGYGQCGNLIQDVAAIRSLNIMTREYLDRFGFNDVRVTTVFHQWMGGFPQDESKSFAVISWGAAAAVLAKATKVIVKTPHEAMGVPTKEANAAGLKATKQLTSMLKDQSFVDIPAVVAESEIIVKEMRCILDKVEELGKGDYAAGTVRAFEAGVIDVPFAPSKYNAGKIMPARDNSGAVRFLELGNIPFTDDLKVFHRQKLEERAAYEKRPVSFQMVIDDVYAIGKGFLVGRPNDRS
ncbi:methylaspartate mutase epsilon subunit [Dysgonomonas sp. PFB1-18]|uniref:methylaspartate mutase subunit E n=1 Tax=unclassified Dysgonomonas TaxID=2630389 RepID=UPI0024755F3D|nr:MULTISPECIES: methylaspartate mutase subunit E [unclassified Dysgonomonas]MDH6311090.1 methylaspartate mutase epsilon subunit [Dysgonomonas sp. PF1-14]MDH6340949.1 methylaspartate mutase epsilon subunit [Dysgonomonas sp. PF1-16]MDH6382604.1 methylaspartate mutase epsilon subunit [Dysgonomonas sp. PFB1-18]MDH6399955.1 methylaspartate mutase epsilon subunit [Dysgonomonas sp. PF1-23]